MRKGFLNRCVPAALSFLLVITAAGCTVETSAPSASGLVITEVVTSNANSLADPIYGQPDWIELYNNSNNSINLKDYSISENKTDTFALPDRELKAGEYLVIYCCSKAEGVDTDAICTGFKMSKKGVALSLSSPKGTIQSLDVPELETDLAWGLDSDGAFKYFIPTPGAANTTRSFTSLEELQSTDSVPLEITEVMPDSASETDPYGWVELYNNGSEAIELSNLYITENLSNPTKARMPDIELAPGAYTVLRFTGEAGADEVPLSIGTGEYTLAVTNSMGAIVDMLTWDADIVPGLSVGPGTDETIYYTQPTPGKANGGNTLEKGSFTEGTGTLRINELLMKNTFSAIDEDGERGAWVELFNTSDSAIDLANYALSDNSNRLLKWHLPSRQLEAGGYVLIFLSGKDRSDDGELHTSFRLGADETKLYLTQLDSGTYEAANVPADEKDNVSYGLSADGTWMYYPQPTPQMPNNTQGFTEIAAAANASASGLMISEVATVSTAKSGKSDWVEIHNDQDNDVDLKGYYLSDSRSDLTKWPIGSATVKAGGYAVISSYNGGDGSGELDIRNSGEMLYLTSPAGVVLDQMETGVLRPGVTKGIVGDGDGRALAMFSTPTPGEQNDSSTVSGYCTVPSFSVGGGYQTDPVQLEMTTTTPDAEIYYTTDGSTPKADSQLYSGPITISSTQTVRAIAIAPRKLSSDETVATYLFEKKHSLPVICLSMTSSDLSYVFGSTKRADVRERAGYVEYYEADGTLGVRFPAGFRIAGAGTRQFNQKSINLYLRGGYGLSSVTYPFFGDYSVTRFKSLSLRNMGQDRALSCLRDAYFHTITNGLNILNMQSKFAAVYINGKYWGLYEFKENQNEDYLASKFGIDPEKVEFVRSTKNAYVGTEKLINQLFDIAKSSNNSEAKWDEFMSLIDVDYFTDYLVVQTFICNSDYYNQKYTHTTDNNLTWRPMFYDLDWGLKSCNPKYTAWGFFSPNGITNTDASGLVVTSFIDTGLFYALYKNPEWRDKFVKRYAEVMNTTFSTENMLKVYDEMAASIKDEMSRQIERWGSPSSMSSWEDAVEDLRDCIEEHRLYVIKELKSRFNLSDEEVAELWPND
jgi:hypothetical protein